MDFPACDEQRVGAMLRQRAELFSACNDSLLARRIAQAAQEIAFALRRGDKVLVMGNGGSAAEAQHFAAELMGRFEHDRKPFKALSLTTDTSVMSALANDGGFGTVFERQIRGLSEGCADVVVALTTSDVAGTHTLNIERALITAKEMSLRTVLLCSQRTKVLLRYADIAIVAPGENTSFVQEVHLAALHIISKMVEEEIR